MIPFKTFTRENQLKAHGRATPVYNYTTYFRTLRFDNNLLIGRLSRGRQWHIGGTAATGARPLKVRSADAAGVQLSSSEAVAHRKIDVE